MIKIRTKTGKAIHAWMMKEYGSWEDHNFDKNHPCALLQEFGKTLTLTKQQAEALVISGEYQATAWNDDEIDGGAVTKQTINRWVEVFKTELNKIK